MEDDEKDVKVTKKSGLFLVDPNPPGRGKIPEEDLFIYVSLTARSKNRGVGKNIDKDETGAIRFISTEKPQKEDSKISYATTNYTNIGGEASQDSNGMLEGFGIESINVKYGASLVPQVDISFTDLRGSSLFDVLQDDSKNLAYGVFFQLPYPVFELELKGYLGNPVTYCLHMISWTSNFDNTSGNFKIDAKFVGFQQAFLADMTLGNVIGTVNTKKGRAALDELKISTTINNVTTTVNTPTLDKFLIDLASIQSKFETLKTGDDKYQAFQNLTNLKAQVVNMLDLIGYPMGSGTIKKAAPINVDDDYDQQPNNKDELLTEGINENDLTNNIDYLSIRDWIIIKSSVAREPAPYFGEFLRMLYQLVDKYNKTLVTEENKLLISVDEIKISNDAYFSIFSKQSENSRSPYYKFVGNAGRHPSGAPFKLNAEPQTWGSVKDSMRSGAYADALKEPPINASFDPLNSLTQVTLVTPEPGFFESAQVDFTVSDEVLVDIYDFSYMRQLLQTILNKIEKERVRQQKLLEDQLEAKLLKDLDFNPKIKYVFSVICNNVQAMLKTIYDYSVDAHDKKTEREKDLKNLKGKTDLPTSGPDNEPQSYPWPSVHVSTTKGAIEERYIGDKNSFPKLKTENFPEIKFIEEFLENYLIKKADVESATKIGTKIAQSGKDTDNWFPINPLDYDVNPYFDLIGASDIDIIKDKLSRTLCLRALICKNYSNYGPNDLKKIASLEGINAYNTMFVRDGSKLLLTKLINQQNMPTKQMIKSLIWHAQDNPKGILMKTTDDEFVLVESQGINDKKYTLSGKKISGYRDSGADFILIGNPDGVNEIMGNAKSLWPEISDDNNQDYKSLKEVPPEYESNPAFYKKHNNNIQNLSYKVWKSDINTTLASDATDNKFFEISDISKIDGGPNISDTTANVGSTSTAKKYINILRSPNVNTSSANHLTWAVEKYLTDSSLYGAQTRNESKALLLLNTLPFDTYEKTIKDPILKEKFNYGKIIEIPNYYVYWLGGTLWRYKESIRLNEDIIEWTSDNKNLQFKSPPTKYLYKIGDPSPVKPYTEAESNIEDGLKSLPNNVKEKLIQYFLDWVTTISSSKENFENFENDVIAYTDPILTVTVPPTTPTLPPNTIVTANKVRDHLRSTVDIALPAPNIFDPDSFKTGLRIPESELTSFFDNFATQYASLNVDYEKKKKETIADTKDIVKDKNLKLSVYNYFKNIYNKWVAGTADESDMVYNACGKKCNDLIDYFQFINRSWGDISNEAVINLKSLSTLGQDMDTNIYFLLSKILRDNNFLFQILPNFINFKNEEDVQSMFKPQLTLEENSSGPTYVCIYAGGQSESVDIVGDKRTYAFPNDSFNIFTNAPAEFTNTDKILSGVDCEKSNTKQKDEKDDDENAPLGLVAFRVAFGAQNQSIFKDVSLDQSEYRETGEYFRVLSDLIDKRGATQRVFTGTDLLKVFKTRSYKCGVEALGCMAIQPLMYFQLDNVPFFAGTYLITQVDHVLNGNQMSTSFSGLRQSSFTTPIVDKYTTFLGLDFDEVTNEPPELTNLNDANRGTSNFVSVTKELAEIEFNHKLFNEDKLVQLGVDDKIASVLFTPVNPSEPEPEKIKTYFEDILKTFNIKNNAQVAIFLSQVLTNSTQMRQDSQTLFNTSDNEKVSPEEKWSNDDIKYVPTVKPAWYVATGYITNVNDETQWVNLYRYRERGYLNLITEDNYKALKNNVNFAALSLQLEVPNPYESVPKNFVKNPKVLDATTDGNILWRFITAAYIFTTKSGDSSKLPEEYDMKEHFKDIVIDGVAKGISGAGSCVDIATFGSGSAYQLITQILTDTESIDMTEYNNNFEKVLKKLNLLSYTNVL